MAIRVSTAANLAAGPMIVQDLVTDPEPQSGSGNALGCKERLEDMPPGLLRHPMAVVTDADANPFAAGLPVGALSHP